MKNEEAKTNLEKLLLLYDDDDAGIIDFSIIRESIKVAIESLEKQIQKKPQVIDNEFEKTQFFCPVCAYKLCGDDFCGDCGQAIDWSNET